MSPTTIPIVFIHIGDAPPDYAAVAVRQARLWNPFAPIYFLSSVAADYRADENWVLLADIPPTANHQRFRNSTSLDATWRGGFWRSTTERLFILEDWMRWAGVSECIHFENDNMVYVDIAELLPALRNGAGISTTFQGQGATLDQIRMCFSVLYCNSVDAISNFLFTLAARPENTDEMQRGGQYWADTPEECSVLPTAPVDVKLVSENYRSWYENPEFPCLFDASAHGQFLGGEDPRNGSQGPGFVNLDTDFRTDQFLYGWRRELGLRYPTLLDRNGREWRIANLHIHCKRLADF
jgi:hypothetical protein